MELAYEYIINLYYIIYMQVRTFLTYTFIYLITFFIQSYISIYFCLFWGTSIYHETERNTEKYMYPVIADRQIFRVFLNPD
jgi:hypothetical protein